MLYAILPNETYLNGKNQITIENEKITVELASTNGPAVVTQFISQCHSERKWGLDTFDWYMSNHLIYLFRSSLARFQLIHDFRVLKQQSKHNKTAKSRVL